MKNKNEYDVFSPGQVLTHTNLNHLFYHLDNEVRTSRTKLSGKGIAAGLELKYEQQKNGLSVISVTKGNGVTSRGYIIDLEETKAYYYAAPYTPPSIPDDEILPFVNKDTLYFENPSPDRICYRLLNKTQYKNLDSDQKKAAKSLNDLKLEHYYVALFLEPRCLVNCNSQGNNNSGSKLCFEIVPLLAGKKDNDIITPRVIYPDISIKRFNANCEVINAKDIADVFKNLADDTTLKQIHAAYNFCHTELAGKLHVKENRFTGLNIRLAGIRDGMDPIRLQYFYDYICDLAHAYSEFVDVVSRIESFAYDAVDAFPLHLEIGRADTDTNPLETEIYRRYFDYSNILDNGNNEIREAVSLYRRMEIIANNFQVPDAIELIITPSLLGDFKLSERAMPYYFDPGKENLLEYWSFSKTTQGKKNQNPGYFANKYNATANAITNPLDYDTEKYNFFRIEGHIGHHYDDVIQLIQDKIAVKNLPITVIGVSESCLIEGENHARENLLPHILKKIGAAIPKKWNPFNYLLNRSQQVDQANIPDHEQEITDNDTEKCDDCLHARLIGVEHKAGVVRGGTFVLVYKPDKNQNIVVADFYIPGMDRCNGKQKTPIAALTHPSALISSIIPDIEDKIRAIAKNDPDLQRKVEGQIIQIIESRIPLLSEAVTGEKIIATLIKDVEVLKTQSSTPASTWSIAAITKIWPISIFKK